MTDPYRRGPKDIALADGHEELRTDRFECETDKVSWEPDHAGEITACDSSQRTPPVCQHCGLAIMNSALVIGGMYFCGEFCKERFAAKIWSRFTHR